MLRRLIIGCGTLGVILVGFGLYRSRNVVPEKPLPALPEVTVATATAPAVQQTIPGVKNLRVDPGGGFSFEVFDRSRGQLQYLMKGADYKAEKENELSLNKPELWKFMRSGQILRVTADSGQISVEPADKSNLKPKRGWLRKHVVISIDLTTRAWREAHPGRDAIEQHPDHVITVEMDSLYFDDDLSLIRTDEAVRVRGARFDIASTGMKLIYSRVLDRLEHLVLARGGTIVLRGSLDEEQAPAAAAPRDAARRVRSASGPASRAAASASAPSSQETPTKYQDIYRAVFEGPVEAEQYRENKVVSRLASDRSLELVFDMLGQRQEPAGAGYQRERPLPVMGPAPEPQVQDAGERTILTWAGSLEIAPLERNPLEQAHRATRINAAGDKVVLEDLEEGNTITCRQLDYDVIRHSGRIRSDGEAPARLSDARGGGLAAHDIRFDQAEGILEVTGPGEATELESQAAAPGAAPATRPSEGPTRIRWSDHLLVRFQRAKMPMPVSVIPLAMPQKPAVMERINRQTIFQMRRPVRQGSSLGGNPLKGLLAESAVITGDALVQRGQESLHAEKLTTLFFPDQRGRTFGPIASAIGQGQVQLVSKDQNISADSLDVRFVPADGGRSVPTRAIAQGHAVAAQEKSRIEADFLDGRLAQVPAQPESGEAATARTRTAVVEMTATGNVRITDPEQPLALAGEALTAAIPDGRQVTDVTVKGAAGAPARVEVQDYALSGPTIQADLQKQDVVVPSAGSLRLPVRQGPEGTRLETPRKLLITWTDRMQMWGERNQALFQGHVEATMASTDDTVQAPMAGMDISGDDTAVAADVMTVYFRAVSAAPETRPSGEAGAAAQVMEKARREVAEVLPGAAEWLPAPRGARPGRAGGDFAARREPMKLIAEGNAKAVSSRYDSRHKVLTSRLLIEGPVFLADLARQHLEVPGRGKLLLENYPLARTAARLLAAGHDLATMPALKTAPEDGLSQTVFAWRNTMSFSLDEQLAVFDGEVNMVHRTGSKVVLGTRLAEALGAKPALLQVMPGRLATLSSENLVVQFSEPADKASKDAKDAGDEWMRRAELENMIATGNVYLNEELSSGGSNFLTAGRVHYSGQRDTFVIQGVPGAQGTRAVPAKLVRQKDAESPPEATTLEAFWWNRRTGEVSARGIRGQSFQ